jgi:hypothetical protein
VLKLISWKHSFKRLNEEYEIAKKKKRALDNLYETGRISQATRDSFDNDISAVITEIEKQQKDLLTKMQEKAQELESQIKTLETLFANYEIQHVVGEIEEEVYQREINLLSTGLESAKRELEIIKDAANQLCSPPIEETTTEPCLTTEEMVQTEPVETAPAVLEEVTMVTEPCPQEPVITMQETVPEQPATETADIAQEEMPQAVEEMPEAPENTLEATADTPQALEEIPTEIENTPPIIEETVESIEDLSQVVEEMPQIAEGIPNEVHPQKAPEEAPQEITAEAQSEQEQGGEEEAAAVDIDESTESQEES